MSFDIKSHLPKGVADALFEEDDSKPQQPARPQAPSVSIPVSSVIREVTHHEYTAPLPVATDNPLLADLRTRTSFESTPVGQQLQGFITALDDTGLPETQKLKTALKLSKIAPSNVIDTLTNLQSLLAADKQKFDAQMNSATTNEVDGRQQKMAQIDSQINELESQLNALRMQKTSLAADIESKTRQIQGLKENYKSAFDLRSGEISTQISHYQSILQG